MSFRPKRNEMERSGEITGLQLIRKYSNGGDFSTTALPSLEMTVVFIPILNHRL